MKKVLRWLAVLAVCWVPFLSLGGDLKIVVFSVGSGDSSLIQFPNGKMMLIDTGVPARTLDTVIPFLQRHGITHLDYFLGTHVHPDHVDGVPNLQAAGFIDSATIIWDWNSFQIYDSFTLEETAWFIYNARNVALNTDDTNYNSVSYRIEYNGFVYSGTGDEGTAPMTRFMNDYPALVPCHVRNTEHHGYGPTLKLFNQMLNAKLYIVSCSTESTSYSAFRTIGTAATNAGGILALTETCAGGARGHVYVRATNSTNWNYTFHPINNVIPNFYTPPPNDSKFISQNVPETLMPGETATVGVTLQNTGPGVWSTAVGHKLGSRNPTNNTLWTGSSRIDLPYDVNPGQQVTFTFDITAPTNRGFYDFQWQMIDDDEADPSLRWFGSATANAVIDVTWPLINAVQNPSFELDTDGNGRPDSWGNTTNYTRSSTQKTAGSYSARGSGNGSISGISQTMTITPQTDYALSLKLYYASGTGTVVFDTADRFDDVGNQFTISATNGGWIKYTGSFNSGTNTSVTLRTYTAGLTNNVHYLDEVSLTTRDQFVIPNLPPKFTSSPGLFTEVGSAYSYTVTTEDVNGDPVTLSALSKPDWLTLSSNVLSGIASGIGSNTVTLRASDGNGSRDQTFTLYVSAVGNDAPVITSIPGTGVIEKQSYGYQINAFDPDGNSLTYSAPVKPSWLNLNGAILSGTPSNSHVGVHAVAVAVSDGTVTVTQQFNVAVFVVQAPDNLFLNGSFESGTNWPANWLTNGVRPTWSTNAQHGTRSILVSNDIGDISQLVMVESGKTYTVSAWIDSSGYVKTNTSSATVVLDTSDVYDGAGQAQFSVSTNTYAPGWTKKTGSFTATNTEAIKFRIFSTSGSGGRVYFDNLTMTTAGSGNDAPVITSVPVTQVDQYSMYRYTLLAADPETNVLILSAVTNPAWLTFNPSTGVLSGTPTNSGSYSVVLGVSDGSASTNQSFTITVAPVIIDEFEVWAVSNGIPPSAVTNDTDADGRNNLYEYAFGGNPTNSSDPGSGPVLVLVSNTLQFIHKQPKNDSSLDYILESSSNLIGGVWTPLVTSAQTNGTTGVYQNVTHTIPTNLPESYIRLRVIKD